jgi:hypothetical protein
LGTLLSVFPAACAVASDEAQTYRYRLTVEVETPEGLRTGSSVIQVVGDEAGKNALISPGRLTFRIFGEAVAVDLPNGKKLFAVLRRPDGTSDAAASYAPSAYGAPYFDQDYPRQLAEWLKRQHRIAVLRPRNSRDDLKKYTVGSDTIERVGPAPVDPLPTNYPMLVTFGNLNDRKTVLAVDARHLDQTFGSGYRLRRITTEITDGPVTRTLEEKLPWMKSFIETGGKVGGQRFFDRDQPEKNLGFLDFVREQR